MDNVYHHNDTATDTILSTNNTDSTNSTGPSISITTTPPFTILGAISLAWLVLGFSFLVHWVACINFMVSELRVATSNPNNPAQPPTLPPTPPHHPTHQICRVYDFPEDSWVAQAELVDLDMGTKYR